MTAKSQPTGEAIPLSELRSDKRLSRSDRRLVAAAGVGTVITVVFLGWLAGSLAPVPDDPRDDAVKQLSGAPVDITPRPGSGGVRLLDRTGAGLGLLSEDEHAVTVACHLTDRTMVLVRRTGQGEQPEPPMGYIRFTEDKLMEGTVIPCGG
ncbi:hypothetical protein [Streptomyces sp. NPDC006307]|uniref:hypothetical protein n=1 Tax=Streptomyces sp. NPDC006307 TaxID=3156748 RepID=UPI0033A8C37B